MRDLVDLFATQDTRADFRGRDPDLEDAWQEAKRPPTEVERVIAREARSRSILSGRVGAPCNKRAGDGFVIGKTSATKRAVPVTLATEPLKL